MGQFNKIYVIAMLGLPERALGGIFFIKTDQFRQFYDQRLEHCRHFKVWGGDILVWWDLAGFPGVPRERGGGGGGRGGKGDNKKGEGGGGLMKLFVFWNYLKN
jgi:hypothetical protein